MNGKKAKALRKLAKLNAKRPDGYQSDTPNGRVISVRNPKFVVGVANGEPEFHTVLHPGTLRHKPASLDSLYRKLKTESKKPGHYFSIGTEKVTTREFLKFLLLNATTDRIVRE